MYSKFIISEFTPLSPVSQSHSMSSPPARTPNSDELLAMSMAAAQRTGRCWFPSKDAVGPALQLEIPEAILAEWEQRRLLINPRSASLQTTILTTLQPATNMFNYMFGVPAMLAQPVEWTRNQALSWSDWLYDGYVNYWRTRGAAADDPHGDSANESSSESLVFVPVLELMVASIVNTLTSLPAIRRIFTIDEWMEFLVETCQVVTTETVTQDLLYKQILHPVEDTDVKLSRNCLPLQFPFIIFM
jgi:hypothetical protein